MTKNNGFTLTEVIVVIIVISIIAAMAIPRFMVTIERHRSDEGKGMLLALYASQKRFFLYNNGNYTNVLGNLDMDVPATIQYFNQPTVNTINPIASIQRSDASYTLSISDVGVVSCAPAGNLCTQLGY